MLIWYNVLSFDRLRIEYTLLRCRLSHRARMQDSRGALQLQRCGIGHAAAYTAEDRFRRSALALGPEYRREFRVRGWHKLVGGYIRGTHSLRFSSVASILFLDLYSKARLVPSKYEPVDSGRLVLPKTLSCLWYSPVSSQSPNWLYHCSDIVRL